MKGKTLWKKRGHGGLVRIEIHGKAIPGERISKEYFLNATVYLGPPS